MTAIIAQLSDVHLGFSAERPEPNAERLTAVLAAVADLSPDAVFVTGDLTESGAVADYRHLRDALAVLSCPVHLTVGNHDLRASFAAVFPDSPRTDGFMQYAVDGGSLRCVVLDTLEEGRDGGAFCERRARWLQTCLDEVPDCPTLIFLHHPPVATGIAWIDPDPAAGWIARLAAAITGRPQVIGLAGGHVHAPSVTWWNGRPVTVAPSVAPGLAVSMAAIDAAMPDGRPMVRDSLAGFALHRWEGGQLTTHFVSVPGPVIARFDQAMQPAVQCLQAERDAG